MERWWRELNRNVNMVYQLVFEQMESEFELNVDNPLQRLIFHAVFIPRIQHSADVFVNIWNNHKMRLYKYRTPLEIWRTEFISDFPEPHPPKLNFDIRGFIPNCLSHVIVENKYILDEELKQFIIQWSEQNHQRIMDSDCYGINVWIELTLIVQQRMSQKET